VEDLGCHLERGEVGCLLKASDGFFALLAQQFGGNHQHRDVGLHVDGFLHKLEAFGEEQPGALAMPTIEQTPYLLCFRIGCAGNKHGFNSVIRARIAVTGRLKRFPD